MAGHSLAGTQSQAVLCRHGQVVQQTQVHRGYVLLVGHAVLQLLSAAGELGKSEETRGENSKRSYGVWVTIFKSSDQIN